MSYGLDPHPLAIAHRGGMALAPENTLVAFERAVAVGVRYLETDVRVSADGELFCFHDELVNRVTGSSGRLAALPSAVVRLLRVGGEPVPTLEEALEAFPDAAFTVDLKEESAIEPLVRVLRRTGAAERVCIAGAWDGWINAVRAQVPGVSTALGWRALAALIAAGRTGMRPPRGIATGPYAHVAIRLGRVPVFAERLVSIADDLGIKVIVWTVNERPVMERLLDAGVRGLITDHPGRLRAALEARGEWTLTSTAQ